MSSLLVCGWTTKRNNISSQSQAYWSAPQPLACHGIQISSRWSAARSLPVCRRKIAPSLEPRLHYACAPAPPPPTIHSPPQPIHNLPSRTILFPIARIMELGAPPAARTRKERSAKDFQPGMRWHGRKGEKKKITISEGTGCSVAHKLQPQGKMHRVLCEVRQTCFYRDNEPNIESSLRPISQGSRRNTSFA